MYFKAVICENSHCSPLQSDDLTKFSLGKALKTIFICAPAKRRMAVFFSNFCFPFIKYNSNWNKSWHGWNLCIRARANVIYVFNWVYGSVDMTQHFSRSLLCVHAFWAANKPPAAAALCCSRLTSREANSVLNQTICINYARRFKKNSAFTLQVILQSEKGARH